MDEVKYGFRTTWDYRSSNGDECPSFLTDEHGNVIVYIETFCKKCKVTLSPIDYKYAGRILDIWPSVETNLPKACPKCRSPINLLGDPMLSYEQWVRKNHPNGYTTFRGEHYTVEELIQMTK